MLFIKHTFVDKWLRQCSFLKSWKPPLYCPWKSDLLQGAVETAAGVNQTIETIQNYSTVIFEYKLEGSVMVLKGL